MRRSLGSDPRPGTRDLAQTILGALGIRIVEATAERVRMDLVVHDGVRDHRGMLDAGALVVLAESVASTGAGLAAGEGCRAFGVEVNASFLLHVAEGTVTAVGEPEPSALIDLQVWRVVVTHARGELVCSSRCTLSVVEAPR